MRVPRAGNRLAQGECSVLAVAKRQLVSFFHFAEKETGFKRLSALPRSRDC